MKPATWLVIVIIVAALGYGASAFVHSVTPYVTFDEARHAAATVQVMGNLDKSSIRFGADKTIDFALTSKDGDKLPVSFAGTQPSDLKMASQVTAIGHYDGAVFRADNLLVKCPSKYQGQTTTRSYAAMTGQPASSI
jgi:cytochrome c-type biogenesis protein CcmE